MKINKLAVVIDTIVLLVALPSESKYHWIMDKIFDKELYLIVSNEVLIEYQEQTVKRYGLITEDNHFNALKNIPFPKIEVLNIIEFKKVIG